MKDSHKILSVFLIALTINAIPGTAGAQERIGGVIEMDKTIHNFGDVLESDGGLSCTFNLKNISNKPIVIYNISTSCGCTDVKWSKEPIAPGRSVVLTGTYTNNEGAVPFDKSLTMYVSGLNKPVILRMRGVCHKKKESIEKMYPLHIGSLGLRGDEFKCGNLERGEARSEETRIANISSAPLKVEFKDVSKGLSLKVSPNPIPPKSSATLSFTVHSVDGIWGKNFYYATPVLNGKVQTKEIRIFAFTKENFSNLSKEERNNAPKPIFKESQYSFGKVKAGTPIKASWTFTNEGKTGFKAYKVDIDTEGATHTPVPELKAGQSGSFSVSLGTEGLPKGETLIMVTLTTNSPVRPIINLFIAGWID